MKCTSVLSYEKDCFTTPKKTSTYISMATTNKFFEQNWAKTFLATVVVWIRVPRLQELPSSSRQKMFLSRWLDESELKKHCFFFKDHWVINLLQSQFLPIWLECNCKTWAVQTHRDLLKSESWLYSELYCELSSLWMEIVFMPVLSLLGTFCYCLCSSPFQAWWWVWPMDSSPGSFIEASSLRWATRKTLRVRPCTPHMENIWRKENIDVDSSSVTERILAYRQQSVKHWNTEKDGVENKQVHTHVTGVAVSIHWLEGKQR